MALDDDQIKQLYTAAQGRRQPFESEIEQAYRYTYPSRSFNPDERGVGSPDRVNFDSTARKGVRNLVTNIVRLLIPANQRWARIVWRDERTARALASPLAQRIERANVNLFDHLAESGFYMSASEGMADVIVSGTGCMAIVDDGRAPIEYMPVPVSELSFLEDHRGRVDAVFREFDLTGRQIEQRFDGAAELDDDGPTRKHRLVEAYVPNGDGFLGATYLKEGWKRIEQGPGLWNPFIVWRWEKSLGSVWGESPVRMALPHIRAVNRMMEDLLAYADFAGRGVWQTADETINVEALRGQIVGGGVVAIDTELRPLQMPGNFSITMQTVRDERDVIQSLLYDNKLPGSESLKYMTAEAVLALREEFFNQVGEPAQRLQREFLQPVAEQTVGRLLERGDLMIATPEELTALGLPAGTTQQDVIRVEVDAAVQQTIKINEAQNDLRAFGLVAQTLSPELAAKHVDMDALARRTFENLGFSEALVRSERDVRRIEEQQQLENAGDVLAQVQQALAQNGVSTDGNP